MLDDLSGCPTSLSDRGAMASWNATILGVLSHSAATPRHLAETLEAAPDFALGHAARGLFLMLLGRRETVDAAAGARDAARAAMRAQPVTERERRYVEALGEWLAGRPSGAVIRLEAALAGHPRDALAMKLGHSIRFVLGDARGMRGSLDLLAPHWDESHPAWGYFLGCRAFALEETGAYRAAERTGNIALDHAADDAWGLHAVAHVHDMTGRAEEGLDWLTGREAAWARCNNFRFHVWWHKALMLLDRGRTDEALDLYDSEIRAERTDDYRDISNATSLLMRLELDGVAVGDRWDELAGIAARRTEDGCLIFADLHYMLALTGGARDAEAARLMARLYRDARQPGEAERRMADPGLPAMAGLEAFGRGDYARAFLTLREARPTLQRAGGSHAQRDVFERLTIDAGIRAGFLDAVEDLLAERQRLRAGAEDGYAAARREMISTSRRRLGHAARYSAE